MNVKSIAIVLLLFVSLAGAAQQMPSGQSSTPDAPAASNPQTPATSDQQNRNETKVEKKARKEREKKEKQTKENAQDAQATLSQRDADDVLGQIRDGLEGHSQRMMLRVFDREKMNGYLAFDDQLEAFFTQYEGIRVNIRIIQSSVEGGKGVVTANFQMEATPRNGSAVRREAQLRFELEHTHQGWRVVDVSPRSFFS